MGRFLLTQSNPIYGWIQSMPTLDQTRYLVSFLKIFVNYPPFNEYHRDVFRYLLISKINISIESPFYCRKARKIVKIDQHAMSNSWQPYTHHGRWAPPEACMTHTHTHTHIYKKQLASNLTSLDILDLHGWPNCTCRYVVTTFVRWWHSGIWLMLSITLRHVPVVVTDCVNALADWMRSNRLQLNSDQTEFMRCARSDASTV